MFRKLTVASLASAFAGAEMTWEEFKMKYGRVYNGDEEAVRRSIFEGNARYIQRENAKNLTYTLAVNMFADLTEDEFVAHHTGLSEMPGFGTSLGAHEEAEIIDDSVDWVAKGAVNPVKDQGSCGSCWAFSTVGTLESAYQIATGKLVSLAEQQLVDCDRSDDGCSGGWPHTAYDRYYTTAGICTDESYSYRARGGSCRASSCDVALPRGTVTGHKNVGQTSSALKAAAFQQPISVTVNAGQMMQFYNGGVVTGPCQGQMNHAVIVVGYGTDGLEYFKIRNSWGADWGERGYVRLAASGGSQGTACLLQYPPVYPILSTGPVPPSPPPTPSPTPSPTPGCDDQEVAGYERSADGYYSNYDDDTGFYSVASVQDCADRCSQNSGCAVFFRTKSSGNCYVLTSLGQFNPSSNYDTFSRCSDATLVQV